MAVGLGLAAWTIRAAATAPVALTITLLCAALLEVVLGIGVIRKARAAWSFGISLAGTLALALLLALPAFQKSGASWLTVGVVAAIAGAHVVLLVLAREEI